MSRRNFILLIIVLAIAVVAVIGFLYFSPSTTLPTETGTGTNFFSQFNPFGTSAPKPPVVAPPVNVSGYQPSPEETAKMKLVKVSSMPVAGFGVFQKERLKDITPPKTEFVPALRYVDKATGNIYQTFADKIEEQKFSTTIIPKIYDAYFGNHGQSVVMRYLKADDETIETFVGALPKEYLGTETTGNNEVKGSFLPNNVKDISVSSDTSKIFYLFENADSMIGATLNFLDNKKIQVFDSPFTEWLSQWGNGNAVNLSTKPSASVPGYIYALDLKNKNLIKIFGGINGLTMLGSPNGKLILYGDNNLSLGVYRIDTRNSDLLGVVTLPEKCVWGRISDVIYCAVPKLINIGAYPDTWYQGEISFSDSLWKIDVKTGNATILLDPVAVVAEEIDGIKLALDEKEDYLFFVNKKDSFLWELDLK